MGGGKAIMKRGPRKGWLIIVCNYNPQGNIIGATPYDPPPKKD
jgi:hypothetical protein